MLEHNLLEVIWTFDEKNGNKKIVRLQSPFQSNFEHICSEEDQPLFIKKQSWNNVLIWRTERIEVKARQTFVKTWISALTIID